MLGQLSVSLLHLMWWNYSREKLEGKKRRRAVVFTALELLSITNPC